MSSPTISFPEAFKGLFVPKRYKVFYGGRGSGKSWGVARALLAVGAEKPIRVLCARELQNSISDSVHKLLTDQITSMGLGGVYDIQKASISHANGTEFVFTGLRTSSIARIKSFEGVDICWVEEAQVVSKKSWEILVPTIRKAGSEIWVTFNPELESDETYKRFVKTPRDDAICLKVSWRDNPWFTNELRSEMLHLQATDPDAYLNVWEGYCRQMLEGAVYAKQLRKAQNEGRITRVPYAPGVPVHTFWDLGWADSTAIWFVQKVGFELRVIDYMEDSQQTIQEYVIELQKKGYVYGQDWLPHDARQKTVTFGQSTLQRMLSLGRNARVVPKLGVAAGIDVARTLFSSLYFDEEKCADGLQALRHYRFEVTQNDQGLSEQPVHDWASHGADAFRYLAVSIGKASNNPTRGNVNEETLEEARKTLRKIPYSPGAADTGWMSL